MPRPPALSTAVLTTHNFSSVSLSKDELELLSRGLSFSLTPTTPPKQMYLHILNSFDTFSMSLRQKYVHALYSSRIAQQQQTQNTHCSTAHVHRRMRFIQYKQCKTQTQQYSGIGKVEKYIAQTKDNINDKLPIITSRSTTNVTPKDRTAMKRLKQLHKELIVKPADKNLGIVLLDTDDYIIQCMKHLQDTSTYRLVDHFPVEEIKTKLTETAISFKSQLQGYNKRLYELLLPDTSHSQIPQFYGIPKVHKDFEKIPPVRPIVSQCNSLVKPAAQLIDHLLQPLAQSYPDYIQNSTSLLQILKDLHVPDEAILVTMDVASLYPSIPQTEMLQIIYDEMYKKRHLILFDPNLIIRLLHTCVNFNFFEFASLVFQQIKGTSMGAAFSPTVANVYMSVTLQNFMSTQAKQPLLLVRYIDDIFMIWQHSEQDLDHFLHKLNSFNPSLQYTYNHSPHEVDFLDLSIYKSPLFPFTNSLDTKTYQKSNNLYQYLHFTSNHDKKVFKAIITGELIRYVRTNTLEENYVSMTKLLRARLLARSYPAKLIDKTIATVSYEARSQFLHTSTPQPPKFNPPIFKCLLPPQFKALKLIVLKDYNRLQNTVPAPRFVLLKHATLSNELVRAKFSPTQDQMIDIHWALDNQDMSNHISAGELPVLKTESTRTQKCKHPKCITCKHLNCSKVVKCTSTGISYPIRHNFCCKSTNLIYVITCTKCGKQYVGLTTKQLNTRINHHRTSIFTKKPIYIAKHFNLPDHTINNLSVQAIDCTKTSTSNSLRDWKATGSKHYEHYSL